MERKILAFIQAAIGFEWLMGGFEKLKEGHEFANEFVKTIGFFASKNPYGFYKTFLLNTVIPAKDVYSVLIPWGEFLGGMAIFLGGALIILNKSNKYIRYINILALTGLIVANVNFWFAAGWTGPSTAGFNLVLTLIESALLFAWVKLGKPKEARKPAEAIK
jgi:uncharacterized membrane protein YphA (DoxX/SURF4 family)